MGMFPWDEWFYHVREKSAHITDLYNDYIHKRDAINTQGDHYKALVDDLQFITGYTAALFINAAVGHMMDEDYHTFLSEHEQDKQIAPHQPMVAEVLEGIAEFTGVLSFGTAVWRFGKLIYQSYFLNNVNSAAAEAEEELVPAIWEGISESSTEIGMDGAGDLASIGILDAAPNIGVEAGTEAGIEAVSEAVATSTVSAASVAVAAGGIFVALGIDMIIGAIAGSSESKELEKQTHTMRKALDTTDDFLKKVKDHKAKTEKSILDQIKNFQKAVKILDAIQTAKFQWDFPIDLSHLHNWKASIQSASNQYFYISKVRNDFNQYLANWGIDNPTEPFNSNEFETWKKMEVIQRPVALTKEEAIAFIDFVSQKSEQMKKYAA